MSQTKPPVFARPALPPLTPEEIDDIRKQRSEDPDIARLLDEIARLKRELRFREQ